LAEGTAAHRRAGGRFPHPRHVPQVTHRRREIRGTEEDPRDEDKDEGGDGLKGPNSKLQTPNSKLQTPNAKPPRLDLFGSSSLRFGVWSLKFGVVPAKPLDREQHPMKAAPDDEVPGGAVPQPSEEH